MKLQTVDCPECQGWGGFKDCELCKGGGRIDVPVPEERGIVFSERLVRAIDAGRKTVTRRVIRPRPYKVMRPASAWPERTRRDGNATGDGEFLHVPYTLDKAEPGDGEGGNVVNRIYCPYGIPGDRLWVREAYHAPEPDGDRVLYKALDQVAPRWMPGRFMPKWATRTWLVIVKVRCERLHDITLEQIHAEGVSFSDMEGAEGRRAVFQRGWDSINGERDGCSWMSNPWVWVVTFRRQE